MNKYDCTKTHYTRKHKLIFNKSNCRLTGYRKEMYHIRDTTIRVYFSDNYILNNNNI